MAGQLDVPGPGDGSSYTEYDPTVEYGISAGGVTETGRRQHANHSLNRNSLVATSALSSSRLFPIPAWRPSMGRSLVYHQWFSALKQLAAAFNTTIEDILEGPPHVSTLDLTSFRTKAQVARARSAHNEEVDRLQAFQVISTSVYWHVRPSLLIDGPDYMEHCRFFDSLYSKQLADATRLIQWALGHVDMGSQSKQLKLLRGLTTAVLKEGSDASQLKSFAHQLFQVWLLLEGSDPSDHESLSGIYEWLLNAMPTKPEGAHLTGVRTWLAGQITAFKAGNNLPFNDFDQAIKLVVAHGTMLGLPSGDTGKQGVLALITPNGDVSFDSACTACDDGSGAFMAFGGGLNDNKGKPYGTGRPGSDLANKPVND